MRGTMFGAAALFATLLAGPAASSLGKPQSSIEADRAHFAASLSVQTAGGVPVHSLTLPNGGVVKEYVNGDGIVFAISWRGPGRPDLSQLLGDRFAAMGELRHPGQRHTHRATMMRRTDAVVVSQGRPGAFFGFAYDPSLLPTGFPLDALR